MKLAVLFGGCSPEYSVSLQSAAAVLQNMDSSEYEAVMVGISKMGDWYSYTGPIENIKNDTWFDPEICTPAGTQSLISELANTEELTLRQRQAFIDMANSMIAAIKRNI